MPYVNILKWNFYKILLKASLRNRTQISMGFDRLHCPFKKYMKKRLFSWEKFDLLNFSPSTGIYILFILLQHI